MQPAKCRRCGGSGINFGPRGGASIHHKSACSACSGSGLDELGGKHWFEFVEWKVDQQPDIDSLPVAGANPPDGDLKDPRHVLHLRWWFRSVYGDEAWAALNVLEATALTRYVDVLERIQRGSAGEVAEGLLAGRGD